MKKGNRVLAFILVIAIVFTSIAWDFRQTTVAEAAGTNGVTETTTNHVKYDFTSMDDMSIINKNFTSYQGDATTADKEASDNWFVGKTATGADSSNVEGLKIKKKNTTYALVHNQKYEDYKLTLEIYPDTNTMIAVGDTTSKTPQQNDGAFVLWFSSNKALAYRGAGNALKTHSWTTAKSVYTLNIRKEGTDFTVWIDEINWSLNFDVNSAFPTESNIVLKQKRNSDGGMNGGYKSLEIRDLNEQGYTDFDYVDVATLKNKGFLSTQFDKDNNYAVVGDANQQVSNHWFAGKSGTAAGGATLTSATTGIKSQAKDADRKATFLNTPYAYENFELSTEIYWGVNAGVVFGERNVYPRNTVDYNAVKVVFANKRVQLDGALDFSTATVTGADAGSWSVAGGTTGIFYFDKTVSAQNNKVYDMNVKLQDGTLTVWVNGYDSKLTVKVADHYKVGAISLVHHKYDGDGGAFKSLSVAGTAPDTFSTNFDNVSVADLEKQGYTARHNGGAQTSVSKYWASGTEAYPSSVASGTRNAGLKGTTTDAKDLALDIPYTYENFRVTLEFYWRQVIGVAISDEGVATRSSKALSVYTNGNYMESIGQINANNADVRGGTGRKASATQYQITPASYAKPAANAVCTLIVEVQDGTLTYWLEGYYGAVSIPVSSGFSSDNIALFMRSNINEGGGLKSVKVQNLDAENYTNFSGAVADLEKAGYTSTKFSRSASGQPYEAVNGQVDKTVSTHWTTVKTNSGKTSNNHGLKPIGTSENERYLLTTPYDYANFRITSEIYFGTNAGIVIGEKNVLANTPSSKAVSIYFANNKIQLNGAVDYGNYIVGGDTGHYSVYGGETGMFCFNYDYTSNKNKNATSNMLYTLNVEKQGNIIKIWVDGYDAVLEIAISTSFKAESIALMGRQFIDGGFKSFQIESLDYKNPNTGTTVDDDGYTNFDKVDVAVLDQKGFTSTRFNSADSYKVIGDADQSVSNHWFAGKEGFNSLTSKNDGLKPNKKEAAQTMTVLNTPYTAQNGYGEFQISTEIYWGSNAGVILGTKNVFPTADADSSIRIYFNANQIQLGGGGIAADTVRVTGGTSSWNSAYAPTYIFKPASNYKGTSGTVYDLHVNYKNGTVSVWLDGYEGVLTFKTTDTFKQEVIGLYGRNYDGDGGGFKSLKIMEATEPEAIDGFESLKHVEELFDSYYLADATVSSKMQKVELKDRWKLDNGILARKTICDTKVDWAYTELQDVDVLTYTEKKYADFEMTYVYQQTGRRLGVVIGGEMGEYPLSYVNGKLTATNGAVIFLENEGHSNVKGHLNNMTDDSKKLYRVYKHAPEGFDKTGTLHTVKVVVKNKELHLFIDGASEPALHVYLGDNYAGGYVSLFAHANNTHGFKDFAISDKITTELPAGKGVSASGNTYTADFDTTKFDASAFKTYYLDHTKGNATGKMKEDSFENQWTLDNGVLESNTQLTTPSSKNLTEFEWDDSTMVSVLTYNKKMTDFVVSYDYTKTWYRSMLMFGTEMGQFALSAPNTTQHGQGVLIYPENDLGASGGLVALGSLATYTNEMRPMNRTLVKVEDYHEKGNWNSNVGDWHTMTVAVISGHCYVYLDEYGLIAEYELEDYKGGYVSLATSGRNYQYFSVNFDNFRITDLSDLSAESIVSATNPSDITVKVGTEASALKLPKTVKVTMKNGKTKDVEVNWKSLYYDKDTAGVYKFTAVVDEKTNVGVKINIRVVEKMPTTSAGVKYWTFDTEEDLKDFKATYLKNAETGYITEDVPNWYVNSAGKLTRDPFRAVNGDQYKEIAILTYTGEKYTNFELEVEYTQQWQRLMVMFGSDNVGEYINLNDIYATTNPVAGFVEMEGTRNFIGNLTNANFDSNDKEKINNAREGGIRVEGYYDEVLSGGNQGKKHTMKIRVVGDQAMMWVDDAKEPYVCTLTDYDGGYISLVTTCKTGSFDNLKITRLDAQGKPVVGDPDVKANGEVDIKIDENASTELVVPEREKPDTFAEVLGNIKEKIPGIAYVIGGSTILLSSVIGTLFILLAKKKRKQKEAK